MSTRPRATNLRPRLSRLNLALLAALMGPALLTAAPAQAQSANGTSASASARRYAIAPGPLGRVLRQFAGEAGVMLSADASLTQGKESNGLTGDVSIEEGFQRLLAGTGLEAHAHGAGSYTLQPRTTPEGATPTVLKAVTVTAMAPTGPGADDSYQPPPTTSIMRSDVPTLDTNQAVTVVAAQVLRDQRPRNMDDALANVSGITQGNTLAGTQDTIMKRGFGGNRDGSIMHNGMPLIQGRGFNAAAESVEVLKGPSSMLYGIMDPGGVVNVVSKRPQLQQYTAVTAKASSYGGGKNGSGATLDSTGAIGDSGLAYRLVADYANEDYWRNFGKREETLFAPSLAWYGKDTQVVMSYEHRDFSYPFDRGTAIDSKTNSPLDAPRRLRLDEASNRMDGQSELAQLSVDHQINDDWKAHFGYSYNRETYDAGQLRVTGVNSTTGVVSRSNDGTRGADSRDNYAIASMAGRVDIAGMRHDIQFGADYEYRKIYRADLLRQATTSTFNYLNPVYGLERPSTTVSASDSDQTDALHNRALFLQDNIRLTDKWLLMGGVRYLSYSQVAGRGRPFVTNTDTSGNKLLPKAGLVYKWTSDLSLYTSYTQSLKPTSTIAPFGTGVVIDSSIAPEESKAYEVGAKVDIPGKITGTLALFNIKKRNVLVSQFNDVTKLVDYHTAGAARSRGVELDVSGAVTDQLSLIGSYAYIDARTTEDPLYQGLRLWNVAKHTASLWGVYDFGTIVGGDRLRAGGGVRYVGARPGDSANSFELPAYTVADVFTSYNTKISGRNVKFQLNVKNLFNRLYYPSSANRNFVSMGDARQVMFSTMLEF